MLIDDDDFSSMPSSPELAFVQLVQIARQRTDDKINEEKKLFNGVVDGYARWSEFASTVDGLIDALGLNYDLDTTAPYDDEAFTFWVHRLLSDINRISTSVRLSAARSTELEGDPSLRFSAVDLENYKDEIRKLTDKIRKIVNQVAIPENLREVLFSKLNAFEKDLNRNRTRWESWLSLLRSTTRAVGDGAEELEPAVRLIERVGATMDKAATKQSSLEYEKRKLLSAPEKTQDDIPF
ncbi:hypothetical protein ACWCOP_10820 [Maricaulaceae bacterium MS644]